MKDNWQEVFKVGNHTDNAGNSKEWTEQDLDNIVNTYSNQQAHEAPAVVGHPTTDAPAYAWVEGLKREGQSLFAKFKDIDEGFKDLVNKGRYNKVSIALYPNMLLRHIGFLGATPPAIKGLKPVSFGENESEIITLEFANQTQSKTDIDIELNKKTDNEFNELNKGIGMDKMISELLAWIKSNFNEEMSGQIAAKITELQAKYPNKAVNQDKAADGKAKQFEESPEYQAFIQRINNLENAKLNDSPEFQEYKSKLIELEKQNKELLFNEYFISQKSKLTPAQRNIVKLAFDVVDSSKQFEFSETSGKVNLKGEDVIKKLIDSFPNQVEFAEVAKQNQAVDYTNTFAEQNKEIDEYNKRKGVR